MCTDAERAEYSLFCHRSGSQRSCVSAAVPRYTRYSTSLRFHLILCYSFILSQTVNCQNTGGEARRWVGWSVSWVMFKVLSHIMGNFWGDIFSGVMTQSIVSNHWRGWLVMQSDLSLTRFCPSRLKISASCTSLSILYRHQIYCLMRWTSAKCTSLCSGL